MFRPLRPQPPISRRLLLPALAGLVLANLPGVVPGAVPPAMAQSISIEIGQFEPALSPYGRWFDHPAYGRIWQPAGIGPDWQPYTDGYWAYMDDDTWLWVANEPWGWAPYHYGRWLFVDSIGWVWRPGQVWAPAWVVWRFGGGYYGWAPAPFEDDWDEGRFRGANWGNRVPAQQWIFVRSGAFTHHHIREVMVPRHSNRRLFDETRDITRTGQRRHDQGDGRDRQPNNAQGGGRRHPDAVIQGPRGRDISRETGRPLAPARVTESDAPGPAVRTGNEVRLYRPDHRGNNNQNRPGDGPGRQGAPDAGQQGNARPDRRPGDAAPSDQKPGKGNQHPAQPQGSDRRGGNGNVPIAPVAPAMPHVPEVKTPDAPEVKRPDVRRPDVRQPETRKPDVRKPEVRQPEPTQPETPQPEIRQPPVKQPDMIQPDVIQPRQQPRRQEPQRTAPSPVPDMPSAPQREGRTQEPRVIPMQPPARVQQSPSGQNNGFPAQPQRQRQQEMQPQPQRQQEPPQQQQQQQRRQEPPHQQQPRKGGKPGDTPPQGDSGN